MYKTFFDKHFGRWIKYLLPLSITDTQVTASNFALWYLGVTETDDTELNIGMCEVHKCNVSTTRQRNYLDSLTIYPKYFDGDPIVSHKSAMEKPSKDISIWNSEVNYCEEFIFPLKNHTHIKEAGVQETATCSATGISEEYASTLFLLGSIDIAPINRDILKQVEGSNINGNRHMTSVLGDNRQPLSCPSKQRATYGTENLYQ